MKLLVTIKNVYGNELVYPACDKSELLCALANTKTFTEYNIAICKQLGYTFEVKGRSI